MSWELLCGTCGGTLVKEETWWEAGTCCFLFTRGLEPSSVPST